MKRALTLLILGLVFNSCEEKYCRECCGQMHKKGKEVQHMEASELKHSITDRECKLIDEWLNRKNMGLFLKNHITFEAALNRFIG